MTALTFASALCAQVDPALWFPEKGQGNTAAKAICHRCDIEATCLAVALADPEIDGIWGGTMHRERQTMRALAGPTVRPIRHGTPGGAKTHRRRGEDVCPACKTAAHAAHAERAATRRLDAQVRGAA